MGRALCLLAGREGGSLRKPATRMLSYKSRSDLPSCLRSKRPSNGAAVALTASRSALPRHRRALLLAQLGEVAPQQHIHAGHDEQGEQRADGHAGGND